MRAAGAKAFDVVVGLPPLAARRAMHPSSFPNARGIVEGAVEGGAMPLSRRGGLSTLMQQKARSAAIPLLSLGRCMSTRSGFIDSIGRTLDPPKEGAQSFNPWKQFQTWYCLYRLGDNSSFPGVVFRKSDFLVEAEKMYAETASALESGDKRKLGKHLTENMQRKIRRFLPEIKPAEKVVVKTSSASVVQARIVYMTQPAEAKWVQIMLDIAVAANPPIVKRVSFDRALHLGAEGAWRISEIA